MKMEITQKKDNPLFKRTEINFVIDHAGAATPTKGAVVEEIAQKMKAAKDTIILDNMESVFGNGKTNGYVKVYESKEAAIEFEPEYKLKRNGIEKPKYVAPEAQEE